MLRRKRDRDTREDMTDHTYRRQNRISWKNGNLYGCPYKALSGDFLFCVTMVSPIFVQAAVINHQHSTTCISYGEEYFQCSLRQF